MTEAVADVAEPDAVVELIARAEEQGPVTGLVNNAGAYAAGSLQQVDLEVWHRLVAVNATSVLIACRGAARHMSKPGLRPDRERRLDHRGRRDRVRSPTP